MRNKLEKKIKYIEYLGTNLIRTMQGLYNKTINPTEENKDLIKGQKYLVLGKKASTVSMG